MLQYLFEFSNNVHVKFKDNDESKITLILLRWAIAMFLRPSNC